VRAHTEAVAQRLADAGAAVEDASASADFDVLLAAHRILMSVECAAVHQKDFAARPDDYAPKVRGLIEGGILTPAVAYVQAQRVRHRFRQQMAEAMKGFDVLLTPTTPAPAPRDLSTTGDPVFQSPWTSCGFPTITVPSGLSNSGLALGIQLAASPFAEERLLAAAHWCEEALGVRLRPPDAAAGTHPQRSP
jgi:Asp-tRNA(Asn)/Glu-tRNA(Gln) amidotransferase A subunit family amidase